MTWPADGASRPSLLGVSAGDERAILPIADIKQNYHHLSSGNEGVKKFIPKF